MRKNPIKNFDSELLLVVTRPFIGQGRRFETGDKFPWKEMGIPERRVRQLFFSRRVVHPSSDKVKAMVSEGVATPEEATDNSPTSTLDKNPEYYLRKIHGGWFNIVDKDGKDQLDKNLRLDDAHTLLEEYNRGEHI